MDLGLIKDVSLLVNAVGAGNCFLLSFMYLRKEEDKVLSPGHVLSLLFFILGAITLNTIFNFTGYSKLFYGFEPLTNALAFAIAPLLFLYSDSYNQATGQIRIWSRHLAPFYTVLMLTIITVWLPDSALGTFGQMLIESDFLRVLWNVHFLCYLIMLVPNFRKMNKAQWRASGILIGGIASIWFFNLLFYLYSIWIKPLPILIYLNITLLFSGMTLVLFYQKFGVAEGRSKKKTTKWKSDKWFFENEEDDPIVVAIQKNKYYKDPNLNIRTLSKELRMPYHELSTRINRVYCQNFNEFINGFRVQEVVTALQAQQHQSFTIMGLAQKAGFKSASAFYAAFKRVKGSTPMQYLDRITKN